MNIFWNLILNFAVFSPKKFVEWPQESTNPLPAGRIEFPRPSVLMEIKKWPSACEYFRTVMRLVWKLELNQQAAQHSAQACGRWISHNFKVERQPVKVQCSEFSCTASHKRRILCRSEALPSLLAFPILKASDILPLSKAAPHHRRSFRLPDRKCRSLYSWKPWQIAREKNALPKGNELRDVLSVTKAPSLPRRTPTIHRRPPAPHLLPFLSRHSSPRSRQIPLDYIARY